MTALRRLVLLVALLGLGLQLLAREHLAGAGAIVPLGDLQAGLPPLAVVGGLLLLAVLGDLLYVPVRRGEETEELTLYEASVVAGVLLLPARDALWVPIAAIALTSLMLRRDPVKSVFNLGNFGASTTVLVVTVHTLSGPGQGLSTRTVLAMIVGLLGFCAVNLLLLTLVLRQVGEGEAKQVLVDGSRLALITAATTIALAGGAVVAGDAAPALLPFTLVPAVALLFAFRATAQSSEQRQRSAKLLALSHVLAGRVDADEMLPAFLSQCRQVFGAEVALALIEPAVAPGHGRGLTAVDERGGGGRQAPTTDVERSLLRGAGDGARVLTGPLPHGWTRAIVAPLEADGQPLGALVLATREKALLGAAELTLLTPLASALAVALRGAAHLRRLTEETSKLQAVVDQSSDGILVLDGAGTVQLWSPALTALTGHPEAAVLGRPLADVVRTTTPDGAACDPFESGRVLLTPDAPQATVELVLLRDDGEQRVVRCAHAGVFAEGGALLRDVVIVHDITRERQVERLKADFIATVSHELRTPVTPIKGYADLLRRRGDAMTPERRNECLEVISDRCDHLARLVEDLLLASRISAREGSATAQVDLTSGDLVALVQRAAGDFGGDGDRVRLTLPEQPVTVACDPMRVIQVLTNLIGNALKYSPAGSPVQLSLGVEEDRAYVDVVDHGRGIPADQVERVFDKFHRVEDPMRMTTGGTGLGLYIARQLASAMGGTLQCASTLGAGSVFRFTLERASAQPATATPAVPVAPVARPVTSVPTPRAGAGDAQDAPLQAC